MTRMRTSTKPAGDFTLFLRHAIRHYRDIGMPLPSQHWVARGLVSMIPLEGMKRVVEIGAGTGRLTGALLERLGPDAEIICVEKNAHFCAFLSERFAQRRVRVIASALESVSPDDWQPLEGTADAVVVSLAPRLVPVEVRRQWIEICSSLLRDRGFLLIQQFMPVLSAHLTPPRWHSVRRKWLLGFPPFLADLYQKN